MTCHKTKKREEKLVVFYKLFPTYSCYYNRGLINNMHQDDSTSKMHLVEQFISMQLQGGVAAARDL